MSSLSTLPKGDSAWLLRKAIERIMQQISILETNIGSSTTGNSNDTEIIFNDAGTLRGDKDFAWNRTSNILTVDGSATITGDLTVRTNQLIVNSSGVGVGTTPSAWSGIGPAIQVEQASLLSEASNQLYLTANGYFAGGQWNYINNASADQYYQIAGSHVWRNGTGGSPGTAIGWSTLMTLNAAGLGVGGSPTTGLLTVGATTNVSATANALTILSQRANFVITANGATDAVGTTINYSWANGGQGPLIFRNAAIANVMTLDASANVGIGVTPSAGKGCLQLSSGINFPATQVASSDANTLDDYEEGTFTPTVRGGTTAGTGTYTTQFGRYTKVGRLVTVTVTLNWTAHTGTGGLQFAGLPFSSANTANAYDGISIAYVSNIATTAGTVLYGLVEFGSTVVTMTQTPTGGGTYGLVTLDPSGEIAFTATYTV